MIGREKIGKISALFEKDISLNAYKESIEWDSLLLITFLSFLAEEYDKEDNIETIENIKTFEELMLYLQKFESYNLNLN